MNKTFAKHLAAIKSGRIERNNIIGLRKAFNAYARASRGYSISRTAPAISFDEYREAERAIERYRPTVTGALHDSGLKVLRNPRYAKRWTHYQQHIIDNLKRFELIRFDWIGPHSMHCVPVYRAVSSYVNPDGESVAFAFRNIPWQSAWSLGEEDGPRVVTS